MTKRTILFSFIMVCISISLALPADQQYSHSFSDDFSKHPAGSDGSPTWETESFLGWEVSGGAFTSADTERSFAFPAKSPLGKLVIAETTLKLLRITGQSWKIAGVAVLQDDRNYWHLALVESPDADGKRHFVELSESLDGKWLAHAEQPTALTGTASVGGDFNWQYNHPYKLKIETTADGITGTVRELDGTERASIGYRFDNKAVTFGRPALDNAGFNAAFDDFSAKVGMEVSTDMKKAVTPPYPGRSNTAICGKATGFFHAERIGDRWWVIDPQGNAFYIIGTDHVNYNVHWCEKLGYAPYHKNCERIYGSEEKWADHAVERLKSWGFNSLAANNSPSTRHKGLAHMEFLGMGMSFAGVDYITQRTTWTGFPNVFSPKFERFCDQMAKKQCAPRKDDPWLLGHFIDNELEWFGKTGSLFNDTFTRPADHSAKIALVNLLRTRYRDDVRAFNKNWGTKIAAFDDLLKLFQAPKPGSPKAEADVLAYVRLVADKYFAVTSAAIREHDPNHMVFGCRFAGSAPDVWAIAGKYCDIVSVNCYRTVDLEKGILADGFENDLAAWHKKTKRPLMITEWSFPALDAGLPSVHGAGQRVRTQADKARAFTIFQKLLFSTPFMVGSNYFMWVDEPELGISSTFPEDSNYGLVDVNDKTYELLTQAATKLHARAYDIHSGDVADVYVERKPSGAFEIGNRGKALARCKVSLWVDGKLAEGPMQIPGGETRRMEPAAEVSTPGGHLLVCRVEQEDSLAEPNPADNEATDLLYVPGLPASGTRIPILVANPTDKLVENAPVMLNLKSATGLRLVRAENGRQSDVPCQIVAGGLIFTIDKIEPRTCATLFAYPGASPESATKGAVSYRRTGNGFEIDNGVLKLVKLDSETGNAFDRVEFRGVEMGSFHPLIYQRVGQDFWVRPTAVENIEAQNGPAALVLDMTFIFDGGSSATLTEVGKEGKPAEVVSRPHRYRAKYRFTVYPGKPYFASRFLWVENTDDEPWLLQSYFHYAPSNIAGDFSNDNPRLKYWLDAKANLCYGVEAPRGFNVSMWKDEAGAEHPDVYRYPNLERTLKPGERFASDDAPVYVISGDEDSFARTADEVRGSAGLIVQVRKAETP